MARFAHLSKLYELMADTRTLRFLIRHRFGIIVSAYLLMYVVCYFGAYLLRFDFSLNNAAATAFQTTLPWVLAAKMLACRITREWWRRLRYTTVTDIMSIGWGSAGVAAAMLLANPFVPAPMQIPRSVIGIDFLLAVLSTCLLRTAYRMYVEAIQPRLDGRKKLRTVIYGQGDAAISMLKSIQGMLPDYLVVGVIDEHLDKDNSFSAAGIRVFSAASGLTTITSQVKATHVLISGSVPGKKVRQLLGLCQDIGLKAHVIPDIDEIVSGRLRVSIRDVTITDLLRREPVRLDVQSIQAYVTGARVLVTGAAGSIGSELCRQILNMHPASLIMLDQSECGIFHLQQELESGDTGQTSTEYPIGDCTESQSIRRIMLQFRPEIIFHAAAYKHVPLMEAAPQESIRNNVFGTKSMVDLADEFGVSRFVLISTDKAVRPSSVMGATKLVAEKYLQAKAAKSSTEFITVRFGNVLNSVGSVVPTFRSQIEKGGPITVTHPDMRRYFMTIPEAVQLVLQAGAIGSTGDVLILDMGEPVSIVDLAKDMVYLSGLRCPEDIEIRFTGIRPGEKLYEDLFYLSEEGAKKVHEKIFLSARSSISQQVLRQDMARLESCISQSTAEARSTLLDIVNNYVVVDDCQQTEVRRAA